ncbi:MAG: acyl-CoA thioesterase [Cyclobacteriaceae bacterium]
MTFEKVIEVRWADCDANRHVRHSAYYDYGAHCRIKFFTELGFDSKKLDQLNLGPILFKEECNFLRELRAEDTITVNLLKGKVAEDGSKWELHHEIFNGAGQKSAHITISGAWMDLQKRKLTNPPANLASKLHELPDGERYVYQKKS